MRLANNDGYVNYVHIYNDGRGKAPPNAEDTKKLFFPKKRASLESNKAGEILHILQRFSAQLRKHTNLKDKREFIST